MRKLTKAFSLALSALMMLGAAVGIKPMVEKANAESSSLTVTINDFTEITTSYTTKYTHSYAVNNLNGGTTNVQLEAYGVYKNSNGIQMNSGKGTYIKNLGAFPGKITSIVCTWTATGKNSPTLYVSSGKIASNTSTSLGKGSNSTQSQTYTVSDGGNYDYFYFDGTTVTGACYMSSMVINYESVSSGPSIAVSSSTKNVLVGNNLDIDIDFTNMDEPEIVTWNSSDPSVGTISNGVFTANGVGITTITASSNDIVSNELEIVVYPRNDGIIGIDMVDVIKDLAGSSPSPFAYTFRGTVKSIDTAYDSKFNNISFTLTSNNVDLYCYRVSGGENIKVDDFIEVSGNVKTYDNKGELVNGTYSYLVTVTFMIDGASADEVIVEKGSKVGKPENPTKQDYGFDCWVIQNTSTPWDFENPVNSDLVLVATWTSIIQGKVNDIDSKMALAFSYENDYVAPSPFSSITSAQNLVNGNEVIIVSEFNGKLYAMSNASASVHTAVEVTINEGIISPVSNDYTLDNFVYTLCIKNSKYSLYNGSKYLISNTGTGISDSSDEPNEYSLTFAYSEAKGAYFTCTDNRSFIFRDNSDFRFYATSNIGKEGYASKVFVYQRTKASYSYGESIFKIMLGVDNMSSLITELGTSNVSSYGIRMTSSVSNHDFDFKSETPSLYSDSEENIQFSVLNMGDVFENPSRAADEFTIAAYVVYNSVTYVSNASKMHSIISLVNSYVAMADESVSEPATKVKDALSSFGVNFN